MTETESHGGGALGGRAVVAVLLGIAILAAGLWLTRERELTIIVVSLDTTRADHLTPYGYDRETTPTLARLAAEGTVFTQARATTSWTLPSHMSLFTGLPPDLHNVVIDFHVLDQGRKTMGEIFSEADFRTAGLYSAPYVHPRFGFGRGMDFYESMTKAPMVFDLPADRIDDQMAQREVMSHREISSFRIADRARFFLRDRRRPRNLLFLHFFDPHYDYLAPPKTSRRFTDPTYEGPITGEFVMAQLERIEQGRPEDIRRLKDLYDTELRWTDDNLGAVIEAVEQEGLVGRTLVVVVADHGEEFLEDGRFGHRMTLRDEVLRIPMIFWGPGIVPEGRVVEDPVALYDVLPTLVDYAEIEPDEELYGRSLRPLIEGGSLPPRPVSAALTFLHKDAPDYYTRHDAIVYEDLKYIRRVQLPWSAEDPMTLNNPPRWETQEVDVYDLARDPGETVDLAETGDPRVAQLAEVFEAEQARQREALERFVPLGAPRATDGFSADTMEIWDALRALGYAEGAGAAGPAPSAGDGPAASAAGEATTHPDPDPVGGGR